VRYLFYSHDGLGLGHVRRNLAIADAVARLDPASSVLLVCSTDQVDSLVIPPRVDVLKLPGVRKSDNTTYTSHRLPMTEKETWSMRSGLIASATRSFAPDILLSDRHPHGAHGELREALGALHAAGGRAVLGLRDIFDDPATVRAAWHRGRVLAAIASDYDRVLVYGNPDVLHPGLAYGMPDQVTELLRFCGYVANTPPADDRSLLRTDDDGRPTVVATAGGGADGYAMLADFVSTFALAEVFLRHSRHVLSREQLLSQVWGYDYNPGSNIVDVYVGYLRRKLGKDVIQTVRGMGYRLQG